MQKFYDEARDDLIDTLHQMSVHGESDALCDLAGDLAADFRVDGIVAVFNEAKGAGSRYADKFQARSLEYLLWFQLVSLGRQAGMQL